MQCTAATFTPVGAQGSREVAARAFHHGLCATERAVDEILTRITVPVSAGGYPRETRKQRIGDDATAAAAVRLMKKAGRVATAAVVMTNLWDAPVWSEAAAEALLGSACGEAAVWAAVATMPGDATRSGTSAARWNSSGMWRA